MQQILITGANAGIGLAIAHRLARGALPVQGSPPPSDAPRRLLLLCRDPGRGATALAAVRAAASPSCAVDLIEGDLGSVAGAEAAAEAIAGASPHLDLLIHNAGLWPTRLHRNAEGFEASFAVNHLAPFVLNQRLLPRMQGRPDPRIVQVTAGLYPLGRIDLARTPTGEDFSALKTYAHTKLWNLLATLELARRVPDTPLAVLAVHPGVIRTGLGDGDRWYSPILRLVKRRWGTPADGARGPVQAALDPSLAGVKGRYFDELTEAKLAPIALDLPLARSVWERSEALLASIREDGPDGPSPRQ